MKSLFELQRARMADFDNVLVFLALGALGLAAVGGLGVGLLVAGLWRKRKFLAVAGAALVCLSLVGSVGWVLMFVEG
ncbi:MAG TPA: hypothetical protein VMW52_05380 [Phycisphaerae bacterium]|nr:hypothetical protein [Phycisphaerae bacterium]